MRRLTVLLASLLLLFVTTPAFAQSPKASPQAPQPAASPPVPAFSLTAGPGRFAPGKPLSFLDGTVDAIKLALTFSSEGKLIKRFNIADKKIVQMKLASEEKNVDHAKKAAEGYAGQISKIQQTLAKGRLPDSVKNQVKLRMQDQDNAFLNLFSFADDKISPILHDSWSKLQNLKSTVK